MMLNSAELFDNYNNVKGSCARRTVRPILQPFT